MVFNVLVRKIHTINIETTDKESAEQIARQMLELKGNEPYEILFLEEAKEPIIEPDNQIKMEL